MRDFIVNTEGEILIDAGFVLKPVYPPVLIDRIFTFEERDRYYASLNDQSSEPDLHKRMSRAISKEYVKQRRRLLTPEQRKIWRIIDKFQRLTSSRFRIRGGIRRERAYIHLVTEFQHRIADEKFWRKLRRTAQRLDAKEIVSLCHVRGEDGMDRQVEILWDVLDFSLPQLRALIARITEETQTHWDEAGVGVV